MHLQHSEEDVSTNEYLQLYGAYFTNVETRKKSGALHYSSIFMARRLFCAVIIAMLDQATY